MPMTDMEMDLIMAQAEVLSLRKTVKEYEITIANQKNHIAALQKAVEDLRKQREASVAHGRWVDKMVRDWHCSECGKKVPRQVQFDGYCYDDKLNYCPNCGSKMDGDSDG